MRSRIDEFSPLPLYHQIADAIRWQIANGEIRPLQELPPTRDAATTWKVHRHTVGRAYRLLFDEGVLEKTRPPVRMQVRPSHTNLPPGNVKQKRPGHDGQLHHFIDRLCSEARTKFGIDAAQLATAITTRAGTYDPETITVVECNRIQAEDLADQLETRWNIEVSTGVLTDKYELPEGRIVATLFHFSEIRRRWPDRMSDVRFLALRPDPELRRQVDAASSSSKPRVIVLGDRNLSEAQNLAADLDSVFPKESYKLSAGTYRAWATAGHKLRKGEFILVAPRAWAKRSVPKSQRISVIRFVFDTHDLDALGAAMGLQPAQTALSC